MNMDLQQDIRLLTALQDIDMAIHTKQELSMNLPITCKAQEDGVRTIQNHIKEIEEKINVLKNQEKKLMVSVENATVALRDKKNTLLLITDQKEYNALVKEIDTLEKSNRVHEEEKLLLYEELSIQQDKLKEYCEQFEEQKKELEDIQQALEPTIEQYRTECKELEEERAKLCTKISTPMYTRYEFIRKRISYPILSPINQGICSACRIVLPSQLSANVETGQQIYTCPSCQRILYTESIM